MATVLDKAFHEMISDTPGSLQGPVGEQKGIHNDAARKHFLKYCDSATCIRGRAFVVSGLNKGWHEGVCLDCAFNPYNMAADIKQPAQA